MTSLLNLIFKIDGFLVFFIRPIVVLISIAVAAMLSYGIFSRTILNAPVFGLEELVLMGAMWLYMLGAALASRDRSHLCADFILVVSKSQKVICFMRFLATIISLFMAVMFATWSYDLLLWALNKGQVTTVFHLPWYLSQGSLFVASILFVFYLVRDFCNDLLSFKKLQSD